MKLVKNFPFILITLVAVLGVLYYVYLEQQPLRENFQDSDSSTFIIVIVIIVAIVGGLMYLGSTSESSGQAPRPSSAPRPGSVANQSRRNSSESSESSGQAPRPSGGPRPGSVANNQSRRTSVTGNPNSKSNAGQSTSGGKRSVKNRRASH